MPGRMGDFIKGKYNRMLQISAVTLAGKGLTYTQLLHSISTLHIYPAFNSSRKTINPGFSFNLSAQTVTLNIVINYQVWKQV